MRAVVVYESLWGNTASIARAVAEGIGADAVAVPTSAADAAMSGGVDLLVVGAPLLGFSLPTDDMRKSIAADLGSPPAPPDLSHPSVRSWTASLPPGTGAFSAFETRIWWSPGSAAKEIASKLEALGYKLLAKPERFIVTGKYGPLKAGEVERARNWGAELVRAMGRTD